MAPKAVIADAGYGSEENYTYLEQQQITAYVKYNTCHKERSKRWKADISRYENWEYDEERDEKDDSESQTIENHGTQLRSEASSCRYRVKVTRPTQTDYELKEVCTGRA